MKVVGITGGIGSGKSTVCKIFELLGIPVFYADEEAKKIYDEKRIILRVVKVFGKNILKGKRIDKKKLARVVFNNPASLEALNSIIHPKVKKKFEAWKKKQTGAEYIIKEAAIMIESGSYKDLDFLITISADEKERIKRITKRDHVSATEVGKRLRYQLSDREREKYADAVIVNDGKHSVINQALGLHNKILSL